MKIDTRANTLYIRLPLCLLTKGIICEVVVIGGGYHLHWKRRGILGRKEGIRSLDRIIKIGGCHLEYYRINMPTSSRKGTSSSATSDLYDRTTRKENEDLAMRSKIVPSK